MSAKKARAARAAAGGFQKPAKVGTPINERSTNAHRSDALSIKLEAELRRFSKNARLSMKES